MLEYYYEQLYPLGQVMKMPEKNELPFYDPDEHDTMTERNEWRCTKRGLSSGRTSVLGRNRESNCYPTFFITVVVGDV